MTPHVLGRAQAHRRAIAAGTLIQLNCERLGEREPDGDARFVRREKRDGVLTECEQRRWISAHVQATYALRKQDNGAVVPRAYIGRPGSCRAHALQRGVQQPLARIDEREARRFDVHPGQRCQQHTQRVKLYRCVVRVRCA